MTANTKKKAAQPAFDPATASPEEARDHFLPEARALPAAEVQSVGGSVVLAHHNASVGVATLLQEEERVRRELSSVDVASWHLIPLLALAVLFSATQAEGTAANPPELKVKIARAHKLRALMLVAADGLVAAGLLSTTQVAAIRAGSGPIDAARDLADLVALLRGPLLAKTAVSATDLDEAVALSRWLLAVLHPSNAKKQTSPERKAAIDERDRLWTLLVTRYEECSRAAAWLFGIDQQRVPRLLGRTTKRRRKPVPTPPAAG